MVPKTTRSLIPRAAALLLLLPLSIAAQKTEPAAHDRGACPGRLCGVQIVRQGGYPELRVDGSPYFVHSATFLYFRIPRDLWEASLDRHRELGINTIDLLIPWNWHQPRDGEFDFDGHTNPRRDLRGLLQLLAEKGFRVIARPGPLIGADWRHAGYPEWLLARPEYRMDAAARSAGHAPPLAELAATDPEAAARGWLENPAHMERAQQWLSAVASELAPYGARRSLTVRARNDKGEYETKTISGPLIFVQVGDVLPVGAPASGVDLERYRNALRRMLEAGGLEGPFFVHAGEAGAVSPEPGAMGDWLLPLPAGPAPEGTPVNLSARNVAELELSVERLKAQPLPPILIDFQAGWPAPADDTRPPESHPANTLLSSRLAMAHGAGGLNYFPLQDTLTPAGYETPTANRYYRWDAALDLAGNQRPRSRALLRNAHLLAMWGERLATTHKRADFGVALSNTAVDRHAALQISRVALLVGVAAERVDPEAQPVEDLLRHALVVLPARAEPLPEKAQRTLVEYVRRGGTLAVVPPRPAGELLSELWTAAAQAPAEKGLRAWSFGAGRVVEGEDFYSWVELVEDFPQTRTRGEWTRAGRAVQQILQAAGVRPVVKRAVGGPATGELAVTQLVSNAGTEPLGARTGGEGFLSVTNLSAEEAGEETLEVLPANAPARGHSEGNYIHLPVTIPARESLLLPLHFSLCATAKPEDRCRDEIIAAGAELLGVQRDGRSIKLRFYTPASATVLVRLARAPRRVQLEEFRPEAAWILEKNELRVKMPRGAWPDFERVLRITLPYTPYLPEPPKEKRRGRNDFDFAVVDAVRLPLGDDASLPTHPPLVTLDDERNGHMLLEGTNYDELGRDLDFHVEGPVRGSNGIGLAGEETRQTVLNLKASAEGGPVGNGTANEESLLHGELEARSGRDRRRSLLYFLPTRKEGTTAYQLDFDRDAASEWVLENTGLRLIVSPEARAHLVALVDKNSRLSLLTSVGGMRDRISGGETGSAPAWSARWVKEDQETALWLGESSGRVEKTVRLSSADTLEVDYRLRLHEGETFAAANSVPASPEPRATKFCWKEAAEETAEPKCVPFLAGSASEVPAGARRLEIQTPGRPTLALEWEAGTLRIEMKNYSAMLRLEAPAEAIEGAGTLRLRYKVVAAE